MRFELTNLVVIDTDCKSIYHTIMTTMAPMIELRNRIHVSGSNNIFL